MVAVKNAARGLKIVMNGSSNAYEIAIESTPVSGVETKNAVVAPFPAPCCRKPAAAGMTPQLHKGKGIPRRDALIML